MVVRVCISSRLRNILTDNKLHAAFVRNLKNYIIKDQEEFRMCGTSIPNKDQFVTLVYYDVNYAFHWSETPEGGKPWNKVNKQAEEYTMDGISYDAFSEGDSLGDCVYVTTWVRGKVPKEAPSEHRGLTYADFDFKDADSAILYNVRVDFGDELLLLL
jgi:hypothetical protein